MTSEFIVHSSANPFKLTTSFPFRFHVNLFCMPFCSSSYPFRFSWFLTCFFLKLYLFMPSPLSLSLSLSLSSSILLFPHSGLPTQMHLQTFICFFLSGIYLLIATAIGWWRQQRKDNEEKRNQKSGKTIALYSVSKMQEERIQVSFEVVFVCLKCSCL